MSKKNGKLIKCDYCGEYFYRSLGQIKQLSNQKHRFCSCSCRNKYYFSGNKHPRWKEKRSKIVKCDYCGIKVRKFEYHINKYKHLFCSANCAGKFRGKRIRGKNHWNWKGGISGNHRRETKEYIRWRNTVYARDYWTCQKCGKKCGSKNIAAHHIKSWNKYPKLRYVVDNGITYCRSCHKKVHKEIGRKTQFRRLR